MDVDDGGLVGGAGVAVCHGKRDGFVQAEDVFQLRVVLQAIHEGKLRGTRVTEDVLRAFGQELLHYGVFAQDCHVRLPPRFGAAGRDDYRRGSGRAEVSREEGRDVLLEKRLGAAPEVVDAGGDYDLGRIVWAVLGGE